MTRQAEGPEQDQRKEKAKIEKAVAEKDVVMEKERKGKVQGRKVKNRLPRLFMKKFEQ